jgi:hypothetical protein
VAATLLDAVISAAPASVAGAGAGAAGANDGPDDVVDAEVIDEDGTKK